MTERGRRESSTCADFLTRGRTCDFVACIAPASAYNSCVSAEGRPVLPWIHRPSVMGDHGGLIIRKEQVGASIGTVRERAFSPLRSADILYMDRLQMVLERQAQGRWTDEREACEAARTFAHRVHSMSILGPRLFSRLFYASVRDPFSSLQAAAW